MAAYRRVYTIQNYNTKFVKRHVAVASEAHVTCRLTAKNRDQLRNPTLGNRVWLPLPFLQKIDQ